MNEMTCRKCGSKNIVGGWPPYASMCLDCGYEYPQPTEDKVREKRTRKQAVKAETVSDE